MKKYILQYETHDEAISLLGREVPHTHLENVKTIIVDLYDEEYEAIKEAGYNIIENQEAKLCSFPGPLPAERSHPNLPPYITDYLKVTLAHLAGFTGVGVKVAVIDTGLNPSGVSIIDNIQRIDIGYGVDDNYNHGGKLCAIIGQTKSAFNVNNVVNTGFAHGGTTYSYRAFDGGSIGVVTAISDCITRGIDIINISLDVGYGCESAINSAIAAGIIVVCASGNSTLTYIAHPANVPSVIAVNGVSYNNPTVPFGSHLTFDGSIGVNITTYSTGFFEHIVGGTSQCAIHVSGLLAIYKQKYPSLNQAKAKNLLKRKAQQMDGFTYNTISLTTDNVLENYQTGAGFLCPLY